jgi:hypothetical protein
MNNKVKVGDKVLLKIRSSYHFTPGKSYLVKEVYNEYGGIQIIDETNNTHHISDGNYEVVTTNISNDAINAYNLIGKKVMDKKQIHLITKISIYMKGCSDLEVEKFSMVSKEAFLNLKKGELLIILHDHGFSFPYDAEKHVELNQIDVKLNDNYIAMVTKDSITVGCQTFDVSILKELNDAYNKVK